MSAPTQRLLFIRSRPRTRLERVSIALFATGAFVLLGFAFAAWARDPEPETAVPGCTREMNGASAVPAYGEGVLGMPATTAPAARGTWI